VPRAPGPEDDVAVISGIRWGQFTLTAAGVTGPEEPIPPYRLHATFHQKITVDPVAEGLPSYRATATLIRRERVNARGEHIMFRQRFKAIADDGSGSFTFHFGVHVFVEPDGTLRFEHVMDKFCSNE
jgi:hypothetical protein